MLLRRVLRGWFGQKRGNLLRLFMWIFLFASPILYAGIIEKPVYKFFLDELDGGSMIKGYVQFGRFQNGDESIRKIDARRASFYERMAIFNPIMEDVYVASEVDCTDGTVYIIGMGSLERITAITEGRSIVVENQNKKNIPVLRQVCATVGFRVKDWGVASPVGK